MNVLISFSVMFGHTYCNLSHTYRFTQFAIGQYIRGWGDKIPLRPSIERDECSDIVSIAGMPTQELVCYVSPWETRNLEESGGEGRREEGRGGERRGG